MDSKGHSYKVVLLGNSGVGKTTLFNHLKEPNDVTAKSDFCSKTYAFGEDTVTLNIWDTRGEEAHRSLTPSYYRRANLAICVYCEAKVPKSKYDLIHWIHNARAQAIDPTIVLIANDPNEDGTSKTERELKRAGSEDLEKEFDIQLHFNISVDSKQQVEETFETIAKTFHKDHSSTQPNKPVRDTIALGNPAPNKQSCNCFLLKS